MGVIVKSSIGPRSNSAMDILIARTCLHAASPASILHKAVKWESLDNHRLEVHLVACCKTELVEKFMFIMYVGIRLFSDGL